jgi:hypothetical protein
MQKLYFSMRMACMRQGSERPYPSLMSELRQIDFSEICRRQPIWNFYKFLELLFTTAGLLA